MIGIKLAYILTAMLKGFILLVAGVLLIGSASQAQNKKGYEYDSTFYQSYRDQLTARIYLSRKYNVIKLTPPYYTVPVMRYKPNTTLSIGIGGTYRSITVNVGVGISSFNPDHAKGKTNYFDVQAHIYTRKWNFDLIGQSYRGFYLSPQGLGSGDAKTYYTRPDLGYHAGGVAMYRALNHKEFSYQAGLVQNEWQKKSVGSWLVGGNIFYGAIHADSVLVPGNVDAIYYQKGISKVHFFEVGPGIGYGYTLVIAQHLFVLASATLNADFRFSKELGSYQNWNRIDFTPNFIFRAGAGYNTDKWSLSLLWVSNQVHVKGQGSDYKYLISAGNYKLIYARRFSLNKKIKKVLKPINDLITPD
ncbi:MAG: hypothetical protein C5B59_17065 [Bacteroidetes bacterium]|nr:MAG: hypothetical protein C5B59_17065 [Bacteroidota bacterium]